MKRFRQSLLRLVPVALAGLLMACLAGRAQAITIRDLMLGRLTVVSGDKVFSNFDMFAFGTGNIIADPAGIDVKPAKFGDDYGIEFFGLLFAFPNSHVNVNITFDVTVSNPTLAIHDIGLVFNGEVKDSGQAQIVESALVGITNVGQAFVYADVSAQGARLNDHVFLKSPPGAYTKLRVVKDIVVAGGPNGTGKISYIGQSFSQIVVPEPSSMIALATAAGGLLGFIRRR